MKKVKTLIAVFVCILVGALLGGCACTATIVSVVSIKISETSDNLYYDEVSDKYLIRQGETFTITYELMPDTSSDKTVYVNLTPVNKISCDTPIINTNDAKKQVMFKASSANSGDTILEFESKDGGKKVSITIEVVGNLSTFDRPTNLKYDETTESFTWDKASIITNNGTVEASQYQVMINDEEIVTETNSLEYTLEGGVDYYVKVKALGDLETRTGDSQYSVDTRFYVVKSIENFISTDGNLTWNYNDTDNITSFKIIYGNGQSDVIDIAPSSRTYNFANFVFAQGKTATTYPVSIKAINSTYQDGMIDPETSIKTYILSSRSNPQITLTKLSQPSNLRINTEEVAGTVVTNSILSWDNVTNSDYYTYTIKKNGVVVSENQMQVEKKINLSTLLSDVGEYTIEICPKGNVNNTFSSEEYSKSTLDFVVLPTLEGTIDYTLDKVTLNTSDIVDLLGISTGEINKLGYEVFYADKINGEYTAVTTVSPASQELVLSNILNITGTQFSILVRPYATADYTAKNVVVSAVKSIENHNTIRGILQLSSASVDKVDEYGVVSVTDTNNLEKVDKYKFILVSTGLGVLEKEVYKSNVVFDAVNTNTFTLSLATLFNIKDVANYTVKVVPMSDSNIDANHNNCENFAFMQLGTIDVSSITILNNKITWTNVDNYGSYLIKINDGEAVETLSNEYQVDASVIIDTNTISIQVLGNGRDKINGEAVEFTKTRAQAVSNIRIEDGSLIWDDGVANSTYYITITDTDENSQTITTTNNTYSGLGTITSGVSIYIVRSTPTTFTSVESDTYNISKLTTPVADLTIVDNSLTATFSENANTSAYKVNIYNGLTLVRTQNIYITGDDANATSSDGKITFTLPTLSAETYSLYIQSLPVDQTSDDYETNSNTYYLISDFSEANEVVVYPQVVISSKTGKLTWTFATNDSVKDYVISFVNDEYEDIITTNTNYDFSEIASGTYTISISATSTKTNVVYSSAIEETITKVGTPVLAFEDSAITFTAVDNANGYKIYNQADRLLTNGTDYDITTSGEKVIITPKSVVFGNVYEIYVSAIGANNIIDGDTSNIIKYTKITSVENIEFTTDGSDKVFTWNAIDNATGYLVTIKNSDGSQIVKETTNTNSYTIPATYITGDNKLLAGTYILSVETIGSSSEGVYYFNADAVTSTFTKLGQINNMRYSNNTITWSYTGAGTPVSYVLSVKTMDESYVWSEVKVATINGDTLSYDLSLLSEYDGYKIYITAIGSDETYSITGEEQLFTFTYTNESGDEETTSIFTKLSTPSVTYSTKGDMYIVDVVGADSYEIYSYDGENYTLLTDEYQLYGENNNWLVFNQVATDYTIVIKAIASRTSGMLDSVYSDAIKVNQLAPVQNFSINTTGTLSWDAVDNASGYLIFCEELNEWITLEGGATTSIGYEALISQFEAVVGESISLASDYTFKIRAYGNQDADTDIYYLVGYYTYISSITLNAVDNIDSESVVIENGVISWDAVSNVGTYSLAISEKLGSDSYAHIKTYTIDSTSFNVSNITNLLAGKNYVAQIVPFSTTGDKYVILKDATESVEIGFTRYDVIDNITVVNGVLQFTIDISGMDASDVPTIVNCNNYADLDSELAEKYKGYYTFKIDIVGYSSMTVTLNDMYNLSYSLSTFKLIAYYELAMEVSETTLLNIKITSVGNSGDVTTSYNTLASFSSTDNMTEFEAYKYPAPTPTATQNLLTEDGNIYFRKSRLSDGTLVNTYYLKAVGAQKEYFYIIEIPSGQEGEETYLLEDVLSLQFSYYGSGGELLATTLNTNQEYIFTLTTMGSASVVSGEAIYLRSNKYATISITFLDKVNTFKYAYDSLYSNGGYLAWERNDKCLGYVIYFLNEETAKATYGTDFENYKNNSRWIDHASVITLNLANTVTLFNFYDDIANVLSPASYLVAIKPIGNGVDYISAPSASSTVVVYKMNPVSNAQLSNGTFTWQQMSDSSRIAGYKLIIQVYDGESVSTIEKRELVTTTSYTLEEVVYDIDGNVHNLNKDSERYGLIIIAVGKNDSNYQAVCSSKIMVNNSQTGYARLDKVTLSVNTTTKQVTWSYGASSPNENNTLKYLVYNTGVVTWGADSNYVQKYLSFSELTNVGDYNISVQAIANGNGYLNSLRSDEVIIIKYYPPQLAVSEGQLVWESQANGNALTPALSTVKIVQNGSLIDTKTISQFTYSLSDNQYSEGLYTISVKFEDNFANDAYSIASDDASIDVYKYQSPSLDVVDVYGGEECEYTSAIKWNVVKDNYNTEIYNYKVTIYTLADDGVITEKESYKINNADYNTGYFDIVDVDGENYIHFNIAWMASKYSGKIVIGVTTLGNTLSYSSIQSAIENSTTYDAYVDSSESTVNIDYNNAKPENAGSDIENGIIRWSGSDNPVLITIHYTNASGSSVTEEIYLDSNYISTYGKVYYLPYMVKYSTIEVQFVIEGAYVSNVNQLTMGDALALFDDGDGTASNPYIISTAEEFYNIKYRPLSHFEIATGVTELNMQEYTWDMIDIFAGSITGYVNSNGKSTMITNIKLSYTQGEDIDPTISESRGTRYKMSMFGTIASIASINNIGFNVIAYAYNTDGSGYNGIVNIAGIAQYNLGTINNVTLQGVVDGRSTSSIFLGGAVYYNYGTIYGLTVESYSVSVKTSSSTGGLYVGGVVYVNNSIIDATTVSNTLNLGYDTYNYASTRTAGGVAFTNKGVILNTDFKGGITAWSMAGIAYNNYYVDNTISVSHTYQEEGVVSVDYVGGTIIGCSNTGAFTLYTTKTTTSNLYIGGIASQNLSGLIIKCYSIISDNSTMNFSQFSNAYVGGLVGFARIIDSANPVYPMIKNSYSVINTTITNDANSAYIGSVVGSFSSGTYPGDYGITNVVAYSSVGYSHTSGGKEISTITSATSSNLTSYVDTLNDVSSSYSSINQHARDFAVSSDSVILKQNKVIVNN